MQRSSPNVPWWESELPDLERQLRARLRSAFPVLRPWHDDILAEALLGLTTTLRESASDYPPSWFQSGPPTDSADKHRLHKLARTILNRKAVDAYRANRRNPAVWRSLDQEHDTEASASGPSTDRQALLLRLLRTCFRVVLELPVADRALLEEALGASGVPSSAIPPAVRQRLHRIRRHLSRRVRSELGSSVGDILNQDG